MIFLKKNIINEKMFDQDQFYPYNNFVEMSLSIKEKVFTAVDYSVLSKINAFNRTQSNTKSLLKSHYN